MAKLVACKSEHQLTFTVIRHHAAMTMAPLMSDMIHLMIPDIVPGDEIKITPDGQLKIGKGWLDQDDGSSEVRVMMAKKLTHMAEILVREHHDRCALAADSKKAGLASELEITQHHTAAVTAKDRRSGSSDWMYPERFGLPGMTLEEYYDKLPDPPEDYQSALDPGEGSGQGPEDSEDGQGEGQGPDQDGKSLQGRSKANLDAARRNVADAISASAGKPGCGDIAGDLIRWAEAYRAPPVVPWHKALGSAARSAASKMRGFSHYDYKSYARRQAGVGIGVGYPRLPRSYALQPQVHVFVDTSGSMSEHELGLALGQVDVLFKSTKARVKVWAGDTQIEATGVAGSVREMAALLKGGGGTDFVNVFAHWVGLPRREQPGTVFFFTDGGGPAPGSNPLPKCKVYWILLGTHQCVPWKEDGSGVVDYGTIIKVPTGAPM